MNFIINLFCFGLSLYVIIESFCALCDIPEGWTRFLVKAKYTLAGIASAIILKCAYDEVCGGFEFLISSTLALFMWQRVAWRLRLVGYL